jgi:mannose-1-phosphate guanylyltransferase/mannose-6-phosphate isomerase
MSFTASTITPVVLFGSSGPRLCPLCRKSFPKQFFPLGNIQSSLQLTLERVAQVNCSGPSPEVICVAAENHRFLVAEAMQSAKVKGKIIRSPMRRPLQSWCSTIRPDSRWGLN